MLEDLRGLLARNEGWLTVALALMLPAAGCIGTTGSDAAPADGNETGATIEASDRERPETVDAYGGLASFEVAPFSETEWANGSLNSAEVVVGENAPPFQGLERADENRVEITDLVPAGIPTNVRATITYEADATAELNTYVAAPQYYGYDVETGEGTFTADTVVTHFGDEPIEVGANGNQPDAAPQTSYTLRIEVGVTDASLVPATVPLALDLPERADRVEVVPADPETGLRANLWGPEDALVAHGAAEDGSVLLPVETAGEHVVLPNDTAYLQVLDEDGQALEEPPSMRALGSEWTWSEPYELAPEGPDGTEIDVKRVPLAFGIQVLSDGDGPVPAYLSEGGAVELASPRGTVAETTVTCAPTCTFDGLFWWTTGPFASPDAEIGTYELTASYDHAANIQTRAGQLHYAR